MAAVRTRTAPSSVTAFAAASLVAAVIAAVTILPFIASAASAAAAAAAPADTAAEAGAVDWPAGGLPLLEQLRRAVVAEAGPAAIASLARPPSRQLSDEETLKIIERVAAQAGPAIEAFAAAAAAARGRRAAAASPSPTPSASPAADALLGNKRDDDNDDDYSQDRINAFAPVVIIALGAVLGFYVWYRAKKRVSRPDAVADAGADEADAGADEADASRYSVAPSSHNAPSPAFSPGPPPGSAMMSPGNETFKGVSAGGDREPVEVRPAAET